MKFYMYKCILYYYIITGYKELQHVLTPRTLALKSSLQQLQDHVSAVYDVTIAYTNTFDNVKRERTPSYGMPGKDIHTKCDTLCT